MSGLHHALSPLYQALLPLTIGCGSQCPQPRALSPCSDLLLWDSGGFVAENLSTLLLLKPSSGRPGLRSRPGPCLTPALGLRREHSSKKDADPSGL